MSGLQKAYLQFLASSKAGAGGPTSVNGVNRLTFGFNPKEYTIAKTAEWKRNPAKGAKATAMPEFTGSGGRSMTMEIFLDGTDAAEPFDVAKAVDTLFACLVPLPTSVSKQKPLPPFVQFGWGAGVQFTAYLKTVSAKYTLFSPAGKPLRAACAVTLEEIPADPSKQNPTSGGLAAVRGHTVVAGDSLASIAYGEYGDPGRWRAVAEANGIDDPLRLRPGTRLLLPAADEV